ncbi:MAG: hypothetical protein HC883_03950 [Bdellovibrionaceae bacterium]|nr:hypothetical protein [Pseudobdellovibrionaceae bacterium]
MAGEALEAGFGNFQFADAAGFGYGDMNRVFLLKSAFTCPDREIVQSVRVSLKKGTRFVLKALVEGE